MSTREFANRYLFEPVGMTVIPDYPMETYTCDSLFGGRESGGGCTILTASPQADGG